ncbi:MAG: DNA methyltransferase [Candidatus Poribacteria bacterium]|nr:DNA methyltransferase [Candidatus Poribacteria bacterium]
MYTAYARTEQKELSFYGEQLLRGRHRVHPYPAMLHPLLVDFLIDTYAEKEDVVFDPFCGSGVTLLQSGISGHESIGFDINPLALLIARAKTQTYREGKLLKEFEDLKKTVYQNASPLFNDDDKIDVPKIKNRDYWYSKSVTDDLGRIRFVLKNNSYKYKDFFMANFAFICRDQSLTRKGEFKRYRLNKKKIAKAKNEVFTRFFSHIQEMIEVFLNSDIPRKKSRPILANSENKIPAKIKYDLVITSPPYGDSRTTVAYGQYSSFGAEWTNDLNDHSISGYSIDRECLGKESQLSDDLSDYNILIEAVEKIKSVDPKRANEVMYFFNGYYKSIRNIIENLNKKGRVCFVVGNRTVKGFQIPMDQITASFLDKMGLNFEDIFIRDILNKVMPSKNSPSNKTGMKSRTMSHEYIVVFSKG